MGPDLNGIAVKKSESWLINFIKSSKTMIAAGDPDAVAIFEEFKKKKMPDTKLSDAEIKSILDYISSQSTITNNNGTVNEKPEETNNNIQEESTETQNKDLTQESTSGTESQQESKAAVTNNSPSAGNLENRLNELEQKLNEVIAFQQNIRPTEITPSDIQKGKQLFEGKIQFEFSLPACNSCHNAEPIDTFNWNPSAFEIAQKYFANPLVSSEDVLKHPVSDTMKAIFKDKPLTNNEIFYLNAYLKDLAKHGLSAPPRSMTSKAFIISIILLLFFLSDLWVLHWIKPRAIPIIIVLGSIVFLSYATFKEATSIGLSQGYSPDQPIKFSHKVHAGENKIDCKYCHSSVEFSQTSGIPSLNVCMNCHNKIKTGTHSGHFEIDKLQAAFKEGKPIPWVKVHNLPDHVYFNHAQHVSVGKLDCKVCHGDVASMDRMVQVNTMSMGWCLSCHRSQKVDFTNKFYDSYNKLHEELQQGAIDSVLVKDIGGEDCQKCHY